MTSQNKCVTDAHGNCSRWCTHPEARPGHPTTAAEEARA